MNLSEPFIRRPVMTILVMSGILFFGILSFIRLPISDLPNIKFPTITVTANNPGSDAQTMANTVATPIEQELMSVEGLQVVMSRSSNGTSLIVLHFDLDRDIDAAATDVASALVKVQGDLPEEMPNPPTYTKQNPSDTPIIYVTVSSDTMTLPDLYDYAKTTIAQRFSMLEGVSTVDIYGSQRALRVKVNPDKMSAMNLGINDVANALKRANQSLPGGTLYGKETAFTLVPDGQLTQPDQINKLIIAEKKGKPIYLADIGKAVTSTYDEDYYLSYWEKGKGQTPTVIVAVEKQSGYNTVALSQKVKDLLPVIRKQIPESIDISVMYDKSVSIKASIWDVELTLMIAFVLVVIVIFLFLGNLSSTIIPTIGLPMCMMGTFAVMYVNGYSIDILSMLGLTLVIGFLVDDAIVVLENIVRHLEMGKTPFQAALDGSKQISTTVMSMTLALSAVFIPMVFMPGVIGGMFHEMAMVIVIAVLISGSISLTLTPTLSSLFLYRGRKETKFEKFSRELVDKLLDWYRPGLIFALNRPLIPVAVVVAAFFAALYLFQQVPQDFLPAGDTGSIQGLTIATQGASRAEMQRKQELVTQVIKKNPAVRNILSVANLPEFTLSNQGILFVILEDVDKRPPIDQVVDALNREFKNLVGVEAFLMPIPQLNLNVGTGVQRASYTYALSTLDNPQQLYELAEAFGQKLKTYPELNSVSVDIQNEHPLISIIPKRDQATSYGVSVQTIEEALSYGYAEGRLTTYKTPLGVYDIILEMEDFYRSDPGSLSKLWVSSTNAESKGQLVPLSAVTEWITGTGPVDVNHINQFTSAMIYFNINEGAALSEVVDKINKEAEEMLPRSILRNFQGMAEIFQQTMPVMAMLMVLGIVVIYLLLGSLYESFLHPLTILSTLPGALFGGMVTLFIFHSTLSLYAYIGMILLIGIVLKNGIMLVEFANEQVLEGKSGRDAIIEASLVRFRPILMTTIAASMGAVPIVIGLGADAESRRPLGLVILGGILISQLITYFFTPVMYLFMEKVQERFLSWKRTEAETEPTES